MRDFTSERSDVKSAETHREKRIVAFGRPTHTCGPSSIRIPTPIRISRPEPPPRHRSRQRRNSWQRRNPVTTSCDTLVFGDSPRRSRQNSRLRTVARLRSRGSATLPGPSKPPYAARAAGVMGRCFGSSGRPETDTTLPKATSRT